MSLIKNQYHEMYSYFFMMDKYNNLKYNVYFEILETIEKIVLLY